MLDQPSVLVKSRLRDVGYWDDSAGQFVPAKEFRAPQNGGGDWRALRARTRSQDSIVVMLVVAFRQRWPTRALLARHDRRADAVAVEPLVDVHCDLDAEQLPGEGERRLVVRHRRAAVAADNRVKKRRSSAKCWSHRFTPSLRGGTCVPAGTMPIAS